MSEYTLSLRDTEPDLLFAEIAQICESAPNHHALIEPDRFAFTYKQLWTMLDNLRALLQSQDIRPHEVVAVVLPDALCGLVSILGVARVCACAPINPAVAEAELEKDLVELGAVAILITQNNQAFSAVGSKLGLGVIESSVSQEGCSWRVQIEHGSVNRREVLLPAGTTLLLHTSATTGRRKVVPLTNGNLHAMLGNTSRTLRLGPDDRLLLMAKLFHIQGIISSWAQLLEGGSVIAGVEYSPQTFQRCMVTQSPTWYTGGPTLHRAILSNLGTYPIPTPSSLRFARSGGAILPVELGSALEQALGVPVLDVYGLTEVGGIASTTLDSKRTDGVGVSHAVGKSTGPEIAVVSKDGALLGTGEEGQIKVRGPNVMPGYVNDPEANRDAFRDGWFLTGDLGRLDADGFLYITGRMKEIINRGGQKLIPDEVDAVLIAHVAIREVATFSVAHASLGEDVACAIVVRDGFRVDDEELREFASKKLSTYKLPRMIYRMDAIPRGATGKPQRLVLRERFSKSDNTPVLMPNPAIMRTPKTDGSGIATRGIPTDLAEALAGIWRRCLRLEQVGLDEDFFAVGGDSISAVTMLAQIESVFSLHAKLSDNRFFRSPTLATLYELSVEAMAGQAAAPVSSNMEMVPVVQTHASFEFYMVPSDGAEGFCFRELGQHIKSGWSLYLLRPENLWHERSESSIEDAGKQGAALVLALEHEATCVIGGFCYGGVVAYETARVLEQHGRQCLLVLFDVPTPGFPRIIQDGKSTLRAVAKTVTSSMRARKIRPVLSVGRRLIRRVVWLAIRKTQPRGGVWKIQPMRWISQQARRGYFSFVRPTKIGVPILHIMATDAQDPLLEQSRYAWERFAGGGIRRVILPGEHDTMFSETNVPLIVGHLAAWLSSQQN